MMINLPMLILTVSLLITFLIAFIYGKGITKTKAFIAYTVAIGFYLIFAGFGHIFVPEIVAKGIGWKPSPEFQYEVGIANLVVGILSLLSYFTLRGALQTVIATTLWLWGNAIGHILSYIKTKNSASGNIGWAFYLDIIIPIISIVLYNNSFSK
jgi:hypothetical protein